MNLPRFFPRPLACCVSFAVLAACARLGAEVKAVPDAVDFGQARQEKTLTAEITLKNAGDKPVDILHVGADCSCTAASSKTGTLAPGESTLLTIQFETRTYQGEVLRRVLVQTSQGDVLIPVKALVSAFDDWTLSEPMAVFAASNKGQTAQAAITVQFIGKGHAEVTGARASVPWLGVELENSHRGTRLHLTKKADAPAGNHQPKVFVATSDPHEPELTVNVFASVYSNLNVKPNPVLLPTTPVGKEVRVPLTLSGWEAQENPRFELDGGEASMVDRDHGEVLASLSFTPTKAGSATRLLRIYAGKSLEAEVPVIVRAE